MSDQHETVLNSAEDSSLSIHCQQKWKERLESGGESLLQAIQGLEGVTSLEYMHECAPAHTGSRSVAAAAAGGPAIILWEALS